jgi:membrane protease YdiL (CAAX protease family)
VQSDKSWKPEAVLLLGAGLMVCLSSGMLITLMLQIFWPDFMPAQQKFQNFLINGVSFQIGGLVLTHFFLKMHEVTWAEFLGLKNPNLGRALVLSLGVTVVALPLTIGLNEVCRLLLTHFSARPGVQPTMQVLEASVSLGQRICFGISAIALAPVVEEILFRAILYRAVKQRGYPGIALLGSALLFGAIHGSLMTLFPLTILAIILALLYDKADNLMAPIVAHSLFNATNFFFFIYQRDLERWWKQFEF